MRASYDITLVSSNRHKYAEARQILHERGISLGFAKKTLQEIQADTLKEVASHKALQAFAALGRPVIVEDAGLFIGSLGGFPGPYSSYALSTIGNAGILRLVKASRAATFEAVVAYADAKTLRLFAGRSRGRISKAARGGGWGYDPIFIPEGHLQTFGQMAEKNLVSHRADALGRLASWLGRRR